MSGLMKKPGENVIRARGKTLGINNWKFNQGGFKEAVCVRAVCVSACVRAVCVCLGVCVFTGVCVILCSSPTELLNIIFF